MVKSVLQAAMKVGAKHDAPKARSAYALYLSERHRQGGFPDGCNPRDRVRAIAKDWKALSAEAKAIYAKQSEEEWNKRHKYMQEYCSFTMDEPVMDLKFMAPTSQIGEFFVVVEANASLGQDAYANTYLVQHKAYGFRSIAKVYSEDQVSKGDSIKAFERETTVYLRLHQAKLTYEAGPFCAVLEHSRCDSPCRHLVIQFMPLSLSAFLKNHRCLAGSEIAAMASQMANALESLHQLKILHGDVKPGNMYYDERQRRFKLANFHLAALEPGATYPFSSPLYSGPYRPPECWAAIAVDLQGTRQDSYILHPSSETWPFVCSIFEAARGQILFPSIVSIKDFCAGVKAMRTKNFQRGLPGPLLDVVGTNIYYWVLDLLDPDPLRRADMSHVLEQGNFDALAGEERVTPRPLVTALWFSCQQYRGGH